jgi:coproporphyrinogen III oxidase
LFDEDAIHFHSIYRNVCDLFDASFYPSFKKQCDDYFVNTHRSNERRGIGGIFFDYLRASKERNADFLFQFITSCGNAFLPSYLPIVHKRKNISYNQQHKYWQEIRRGRYIEINLIHDRGTLFGLKTNGRTESILMSLPPTARFEYDYTPPVHSPEEQLLQVCLHPKEWI